MLTLLEIANHVCQRLNQYDANSLSLCKQFVQRRYQMIYDSRNWRDAQKNVSASLTDTTNGLLAMPVDIERAIAIRANGDHILYPVDSPMLMQLDPTIFERSGVPVAYEEFTDETQTPTAVMIRFKPIPQAATPLLITGIRPINALVQDTDVPIIRGIDNVLIAFTTGDMLERQRQFGKSQAKFQEAAALLQEMVDGDTKDSGYMPRVIPSAEPSYVTSELSLGWGGRWSDHGY